MIQLLRSWPGGPSREFADTRPTPSWGIRYDGPLPFAGSYFCDSCKKRVYGVHRLPSDKKIRGSRTASVDSTQWVCQGCRPRPGLEPKGFKKYREAKKAKTC